MPAKVRLALTVAVHLGEAILVPLVLFYAVVTSFGLRSDLAASLRWAYLAVVVRLVCGARRR